MRRVGSRPWIVVFACLGASCTYISTSTFEEKRDSIDEDGDGSPWSDDCDDENPARSPDIEEIAYDGVDNDCGSDGDVVDRDGDGFPGISEDAYAALDPVEPFPEALRGRPLDCADDPAVHPEAATIHPAPNDGEVAYDGLDSDCDGSNDFDVDGDGYLPTTVVVDGATVDVASAFDAFVAAWGYADRVAGWAPPGATAPVVGDCNDFEALVHPGSTLPEVWYDGADQDCDGSNDFDQDGDGWMPAGASGENAALYEQFVNQYYQGDPPWTLPADVTLPDGTVLGPFDDCLDRPVVGLAADPASVYPRPGLEGDVWYDGIDTNCWTDNDFDQDGDAFIPDGQEAAYATYVTSWGYEALEAVWGAPSGLSAPKPGDCNDTDPQTYPEALERIGDGNDQDCDGSPDAATFAFADWTWDRPSAPRATRIGATYVMAVTARAARIGGTDLDEIGLALAVPLSEARTGAVPVAVQFKGSDASRPVDEVVDLALIPNDTDLSGDGLVDPAAWLGTAFTAEVNGYTYLFGRQLYENSSSGTISVGASVSNYTLDGYTPGSLEVAVNPLGEPYLLACAPTLLHVIQGTAAAPTEPELEEASAGLGDLCFLTTDPYTLGGDEVVEFTRCDSNSCQQFTLLRSTELVTAPGANPGESWTEAQSHGDLQILVDGDSLVVRETGSGADSLLFEDRGVSSADAVLLAGTLFAAAVVDDGDGPRVELAYGVYPAVTQLPLPFTNPALPDAEPYAVALHVDADRVLVTVSARDPNGAVDQDTVGWVFLGTP